MARISVEPVATLSGRVTLSANWDGMPARVSWSSITVTVEGAESQNQVGHLRMGRVEVLRLHQWLAGLLEGDPSVAPVPAPTEDEETKA